MSDTSRSPSLSEVLRHVFSGFTEDMHVAMPVRVESHDAAKQSVNLQPVIKQGYLDEEGVRVAERLPVLVNVPVQFPGSGKFRITFPIHVGDTGLAVFSESSLDTWLAQGGEVDPLDDRRFHLSDAVFLPGIRDFAHALSDVPTDRMTIGVDEGVQIHIDEDGVKIGSNSGAELEAAALGDAINTYLNVTLKAWLSLVGTFITGLGFAGGPPPSPPTLKSTSVSVKK